MRGLVDAFDLLRRTWRAGGPALFLDGAASSDTAASPSHAAGGEAAAAPALRRWSYLALDPSAALCIREGEAWWREGEDAWTRVEGSACDLLRRLHAPGPAVEGVPFPHGVAGVASYEAGRLVERLPSTAVDDTALPWLLFFRFDAVWAQPLGGPPVLHARSAAAPPLHSPDGEAERRVAIGQIEPQLSPKEFEAMVVRAKALVRAGEVFQVNLSHRLECDVEGSPLDLYARLRAVNPAPFSAFFSSGPLPWDEEGFTLRGGRLEARPIAGTRRRDADPLADAALMRELRADPKEQAEHVMMVDLARNDLGRVARYGSVRVPDMLTVETYRTVHHLVSVVEAQLAEGKDWVDALRALFPGGTITGAPKVRAMEVIEELEPVRRGAYTGSLGWVGPAGDCDFSILIRTICLRKGRAHLQVGAGIVEESDPRREYEETLAKAMGLLLALGRDPP